MWVCVRPVLSPVGWVQPGRVVPDGDPILSGCEGAFERLAVDGGNPGAPAPVEQATADPGERRPTRRR